MTHICVGNLTIIGSDNGLSPGRHQAIIWTNAEMLLIGPLGTSFSEILIEMHTSSFKKIYLNLSSAKWQPFCLGFNVLMHTCYSINVLDNGCAYWNILPHYWTETGKSQFTIKIKKTIASLWWTFVARRIGFFYIETGPDFTHEDVRPNDLNFLHQTDKFNPRQILVDRPKPVLVLV